MVCLKKPQTAVTENEARSREAARLLRHWLAALRGQFAMSAQSELAGDGASAELQAHSHVKKLKNVHMKSRFTLKIAND